jgi:hypothetical protein
MGALAAVITPHDPATAFWVGAGVGIGLGIGWVIYTGIVVLALHLAGRDYAEIVKQR